MQERHREAEIYAFVGTEIIIDDDGRIWRIAERRGPARTFHAIRRRRAEKHLKNGYLQMRVRTGGGKRLHVYAHRLVWFHVNGALPPGLEVNHRNGSKGDNRPSNLEAVTPKENQIHSRDVIHSMRVGERHASAKLTVKAVRSIRARRAAGERICDLSHEYGVVRSTIARAISHDAWKCVK